MTLEQVKLLMEKELINHVECLDNYEKLTIDELIDKEIITHTDVLDYLKSLDSTTKPEDEPTTTEPKDEPTTTKPTDDEIVVDDEKE